MSERFFTPTAEQAVRLREDEVRSKTAFTAPASKIFIRMRGATPGPCDYTQYSRAQQLKAVSFRGSTMSNHALDLGHGPALGGPCSLVAGRDRGKDNCSFMA